MSSGHSQSRVFRRKVAVHYVMGEKSHSKRWRDKKVGWFGRASLAAIIVLFGVFTYEVRQLLLAPDGELASIQTALPFGSRLEQTNEQIPAIAKNIVELDQILNEWTVDHSGQEWGIVVQSLDGPMIDATAGTKNTFEARSLYRLFMAVAVYDQVSVDKHTKTMLKVDGKQVSVAKCLERLVKSDDALCADAFGQWLDTAKASQFFRLVGMKQTTFVIPARSVQTTAADVQTLMDLLEGKNNIFPVASGQSIAKLLQAQDSKKALVVSCPGCKPSGIMDYGVGRLEAAGTVRYSTGSYRLIVLGDGGTSQELFRFTGKIQQAIQDTIYGNQIP